jgi:hypothetical protein
MKAPISASLNLSVLTKLREPQKINIVRPYPILDSIVSYSSDGLLGSCAFLFEMLYEWADLEKQDFRKKVVFLSVVIQ